MNKLLINIILILFTGSIGSTGCMSYANYKSYEKQQSRKAMVIRGNEGGAEIGVDITAMEVLKERPLETLLAAVVDGAIGYGLYYISQDDNSKTRNSQDVNISISGDNNQVNYMSPTTTSTVENKE